MILIVFETLWDRFDTFRARLHIEVKKKIQISKIVVQFLITQFEELFARV